MFTVKKKLTLMRFCPIETPPSSDYVQHIVRRNDRDSFLFLLPHGNFKYQFDIQWKKKTAIKRENMSLGSDQCVMNSNRMRVGSTSMELLLRLQTEWHKHNNIFVCMNSILNSILNLRGILHDGGMSRRLILVACLIKKIDVIKLDECDQIRCKCLVCLRWWCGAAAVQPIDLNHLITVLLCIWYAREP